MYLYVATSLAYYAYLVVKIGCTRDPIARWRTYLTGCPPGMEPSQDIYFCGVWETGATTSEELTNYEDIVHNRFHYFRLMRRDPGDSEWFRFRVRDPLTEIAQFLENRELCPWIKRRVPLDELKHIELADAVASLPPRFMRQQVRKNTLIAHSQRTRIDKLNAMQEPVIVHVCEELARITASTTPMNARAGHIIAPCGSGKTVIMCEALRRAGSNTQVQRVVICVPTGRIAAQWRETLISRSVFSANEITMVGSDGTTNVDELSSVTHVPRYCIISTYMSSDIIAKAIAPSKEMFEPRELTTPRDDDPDAPTSDARAQLIDLIILDEAHHMAGVFPATTAEDDPSGEGRTRTLFKRATKRGIPRIAMTFTPKFIAYEKGQASAASLTREYSSMDDNDLFGPPIVNISLRSLINSGILPDYHIWALYDEMHRAQGLLGKAECIAEAWRATETVRVSPNHDIGCDNTSTVSRNILHHLIIFTHRRQEATDVAEFFRGREEMRDTLVLNVESGTVDQINATIAQFEAAPRAILINCYVLGEGVDIPCANAVAIMYPKRAIGQITQMILRAGRWALDKAVFHILVPILDHEEDMDGFTKVIVALATCDSQVSDEVRARACARDPMELSSADDNILAQNAMSIGAEHIILDEFEGTDVARLRQSFESARAQIVTRTETRRIREICEEYHIDTSVQYRALRVDPRTKWPELPEDPRLAEQTWYDFLHPRDNPHTRVRVDDFARNIIDGHQIRIASEYDQWRGKQPTDIARWLPTIQHIIDGYFGKENANFGEIIERYSQNRASSSVRRR